MLQEWIPDAVWLNVLALDNMDAFRGLPDAVSRGDAAWRAWCADCWNLVQAARDPVVQSNQCEDPVLACAILVALRTAHSLPHQPHLLIALTCASRYDQEAPERSPVPEYDQRLTKFQRMCIVKARLADRLLLRCIY